MNIKKFGEPIRAALNQIYSRLGWRLIRIAYARADIQDIVETREDFRARLESDTRVIEAMFDALPSDDRRSHS